MARIDQPYVGVVGLGNMGRPFVQRLIARERNVCVHDLDRDRQAAAVALGAEGAASLAELAGRCATILLSLPSPAASAAVLNDLVASAPGPRVVIDTSTNDPQTARKLADVAVGRGWAYIDAPVSGGPSRAATGELSVMVGGDEQAVRGVWPVLTDIGAQVEYVGPSGSGTVAKLLNNFIAIWGMIGMSQAFNAARRLDVPLQRLYDVMAKSSARSYSLDRNFPKLRDDDFRPNFSLALAQKDMRLAVELIESAGLRPFAGRELAGLFDTSTGDDAELDVAVIARRLGATRAGD